MAAVGFITNAIGLAGAPESGAKLFSYVKSTTTPQAVFTNSGLTTPAANPVIADSLGAFEVYLDGTKNYTLRMKTADESVTLFEIEYDSGTALFTVVYATIPNFNAYMQSIQDALNALGADLIAAIEQVADIDAEVVIVADAMEDVEIVADNIDDVQAVAAAIDSGTIPLSLRPLVVLVSGQSNTVYRPSYSWTVPTNLTRWNWDFDPTHVGTAFAAPSASVLGLADSIGNELARRYPLRQIYVINIGRDNTPIANWLPSGSPDMYAAVKANIEAALAVIGATVIDHVFWWQGESDSGAGSTTYVSNFETLHARWRTETWWPYNTPITMIGISELFSTANAQFNKNYKQLVSREPDTRSYVHSAILPDAFWDDYLSNIHANGEGFAAIGRMAAEAAYGPKHNALQHFFTDPYTAGGLLWKDQSASTQLGVRNDSTNSAAIASLAITGSAGQLSFNAYSAAAPLFANSMVEFWTGSGPRFFSALDANGSYEFFTNTTRRLTVNNSGLTVAGAVVAAAAGNPGRFTNTTDNASVQALIIEGDRATPATSDIVYASWNLSNASGTQVEFARIAAVGSNVNAGVETGYLQFSVATSGALSAELRLTHTNLTPNANAGSALGSTTLGWNGLHLGTGTAINWNNGDVTVTHSSDALAFAGASSGYSFDAAVSMSAGFTVGDANFAAVLFGGSPLITLDSGSDALGYVRGDNKLQLIVGGTEAWSATPTAMYAAGAIELGHATDTTIARIAAGRASIEGNEIATLSQPQTFTGAKTVSVAGLPLRLTNTTDGANNIGLIVESDRATPAANDNVVLSFCASDSAGNQDEAGAIRALFTSVTSGSETSRLDFFTTLTGTSANRMVLSSNSLSPATNDGASLGTTSLNWADLCLASGGAINWNNGDVTVTHAANTLAFAGASTGYSFDALIAVAGTGNVGSTAALRTTGSFGGGIALLDTAYSGLYAQTSGTELVFYTSGSSTRLTLGATSTFAGALTVSGAFTSLGIDDNATGERLQLADTVLTLGASGAAYNIAHPANDQALNISGGPSDSAGANIYLYGGTNALFPNAGWLRYGASLALTWNATLVEARIPFQATVAGTPGRFTNTTDGANVQGLIIEGDRATPTSGDIVYASFNLSDSAGNQDEFARISMVANDVTSGSEDSYFLFGVRAAGTLGNQLRLTPTYLAPHTNDALALGTGSLSWSDLSLASGAIINFNNGNLTATHSAGNLLVSSASASAPISVRNTTDAAANTGLIVESDRATPGANDNIIVDFRLSDSAGNQDTFARITAIANVVTSTTESGNMTFGLMKAGTLTTLMILGGSASTLAPNTNDALALGTTSLMWSDLFLASGGVVNFNNGDVLITHSANTLAFTGASTGYSFDAPVTVSGAFTSLGIDDNATGERLQLADTVLTLGASGAAYNIAHPANDQALNISGGSSDTAGANIYLFGGTNAFTSAGWLRSDSTLAMSWNSAEVEVRIPFRTPTHTPASAGASGAAGRWAWDATYIYICTATNTWRRIAHATW